MMKNLSLALALVVPLASTAWVIPPRPSAAARTRTSSILTRAASTVLADEMMIAPHNDLNSLNSDNEEALPSRREFMSFLGGFAATTLAGTFLLAAKPGHAEWISNEEFDCLVQNARDRNQIDHVQFSGYENTNVHVLMKDGTHLRVKDLVEPQGVADLCDQYSIRSNFVDAEHELERREEQASQDNALADDAAAAWIVIM